MVTKMVLGANPLGQSGNCHQPSFFTDKTTQVQIPSSFLDRREEQKKKDTKEEGNRVGAESLPLVRRTARSAGARSAPWCLLKTTMESFFSPESVGLFS